jgi:acyl carrier protein
MSRAEITAALVGLLRERLLQGSDRPIAVDASLAQLDLDSLGTLEFMAAVETAFGVEIPDEFWMRPAWTVSDLGAFLEGAGASARPGPP